LSSGLCAVISRARRRVKFLAISHPLESDFPSQIWDLLGCEIFVKWPESLGRIRYSVSVGFYILWPGSYFRGFKQLSWLTKQAQLFLHSSAAPGPWKMHGCRRMINGSAVLPLQDGWKAMHLSRLCAAWLSFKSEQLLPLLKRAYSIETKNQPAAHYYTQ
jgi:hypothetical protein